MASGPNSEAEMMGAKKSALFLVLALALILPSQGAGQGNLWRTTLSMARSTFLPGERVEVIVESRTTAGQPLALRLIEGSFLLDGKQRCEMPSAVASSAATSVCVEYVSSVAPPRGEPLQDANASRFWINEWCPNWRIGRPNLIGRHEFCFRPSNNGWQRMQPSCVTFEVLRPEGVDAEAYKLLSPSIVNLARECHKQKGIPETILHRYPASTYAGYVLLGMGPNAVLSWSMFERTQDQVKQYKNDYPAQFEQFEAFLPKALAYLKTHPDFLEAEALRQEIVTAYLLFGEPQKAVQQLHVLAGMGGVTAPWAKGWIRRWEDYQRQRLVRAEDAEAIRHFRGEPLKHPDEVIKLYPHSGYAAAALWEMGYAEFHETDMQEGDAERDLFLGVKNRGQYSRCPSCSCANKKELCLVIPPWERLYREFPDYSHRIRLLGCLSRAYFLIGEPDKAVPLLQELLTKYPDSEWGKKGAAYKQVLVQHQYWPKE
jgi:hypothetical protein